MRAKTGRGACRRVVRAAASDYNGRVNESPADRLRLALEMFSLGEDMMREKIARDKPGASPVDRHEALHRWLRERPGAKFGDTIGKLRRR
jgi:hypothetical protein